MSESKEVKKQELPISTRFMNKVVSQFSSGVGEVALTKFQMRLAQNYFIAIDTMLAKADAKRITKRDPDPLPIAWANVDMAKLSQDVVACARIGLDPAQRNHVAMMPFKNNSTNKYDVVFVEGYRGIELKAEKYGLDVPDAVIVELVYSKDKFKSIKKDLRNEVENYEFEVVNDFDRGEIVGGFYYHAFKDNPEKNKLVVFTLKDILKRKPRYASVEFWGGDKDVWENKKKVGTEKVEGWYEKMCEKTIARAAYGNITIDSQKIDDDFLRLRAMEDRVVEVAAEVEVAENANKTVLDAEFIEGEPKKGNGEDQQQPEPDPRQPASGQNHQTAAQAYTAGPDF